MKDIIAKYRQHKLFSNLNIVLASLVMAFGINFLLVDGTEIGKNLKTSVLNSQTQENKSDLSIEKFEDSLYIVSNKNINQIESLSLSLTYNPENITIGSINSSYGNIVNLTNTPGISSIILTTDKSIDILSGEKVIKIDITKKEVSTENLNILNANFKDSSGERFLLSTSGITF